MDGFGLRDDAYGNAVAAARKPNIDGYLRDFPNCRLKAAGKAVGLPDGVIGTSEVGHRSLSAGRVVPSQAELVNAAIENSSFYSNPAVNSAIDNCIEKNTGLHVIGVVEKQAVHADIAHALAILELCKQRDFSRVFVHFICDGRDSPPKSALQFLEIIEKKLEKYGWGKVATVSGRYFSMDRDNRWERTELSYRAIVEGKGLRVDTARKAIELAYSDGETDEFIVPRVIGDYSGFKEGDSVIFFNFRRDRIRQLTCSVSESSFDKFPRAIPRVFVCAMTQYYPEFKGAVAFPDEKITVNLPSVLSSRGMLELRVAETEKYGHVTYFFNCEREEPFPGEERILIPSDRSVPYYYLKPEMRAREIADTVVSSLDSKKFGFVLCNFANCDMVGHSGEFEPTVKAVEIVDECVGRVVEKVLSLGGVALVTADHGNAEQKLDEQIGKLSAHTVNEVPFILVSKNAELQKNKVSLKSGGVLGNVAPTILEIMGIEKPAEMTCDSLIEKT
jgi:2,3-bisphosphoglycerate-independent phosphoglycerate mutase